MELKHIVVEAHYQNSVILDQCPKCGGIWFDYFELYETKPGEAEKIEKLNVDTLLTSSQINKNALLCPKDRTRLDYFTDPFFPKDIIIARCPECKGFWLNRGEFAKYDKFRQSRKKPETVTGKDAELGKKMVEIIAAQGKDYSSGSTANLWDFLSVSNLLFRVLLIVLRFFTKI